MVKMADPFLPSGAPAHPFQQPIPDLFQPGPSPQLSATAWRWHNQSVECQPAQWNEQQWNKWQTDSSSRVVWQCLVLPLVARVRAYRNQAWCSELVYDLPISWSPLLPSSVRLLCSHLQLPFNRFANENSIAKQRCHSKRSKKLNFSNTMSNHSLSPYSSSSFSSPRKVRPGKSTSHPWGLFGVYSQLASPPSLAAALVHFRRQASTIVLLREHGGF